MAGEMIERVAKAIAEAPLKQSDTIDQDYATMARAALEAMREPTEAIRQIKTMSISYGAEDIWRTMIDEALK